MSEIKTPPVSIRFPPDLLVLLKARAVSEDRSLASLLVFLTRQGMVGWIAP